MSRLATTYMGLPLEHPLVASASPLTRRLDDIRRLEDAGAAAVVLGSLFEEQITGEGAAMHEHLLAGSESFAESLSYLPEIGEYAFGPQEYLDLIEDVTRATDLPVIASLNAASPGGWTQYATWIEQAGAHALELNIYRLPTDPAVTGAEVEEQYLDIVRTVRAAVKIPLAVKLSPYFSSIANLAQSLDELGADALVLFNRFYQPDFDLEALEVVPSLELSTPWEGRLVMRWIAILWGRIRAGLAATTGVHQATDAVKMLMAGAEVAMLCSALLRGGPERLTALREDLLRWLDEHEYETVAQVRGALSQRSCPDPAAFERANYLKTLLRY